MCKGNKTYYLWSQNSRFFPDNAKNVSFLNFIKLMYFKFIFYSLVLTSKQLLFCKINMDSRILMAVNNKCLKKVETILPSYGWLTNVLLDIVIRVETVISVQVLGCKRICCTPVTEKNYTATSFKLLNLSTFLRPSASRESRD